MRKEVDINYEGCGKKDRSDVLNRSISKGGNHATMQNIVKCVSMQRYDECGTQGSG